MRDVIVVGGGCAGLTAALYSARAGKTTLLFESENFGGQITSAHQVDNYPGIPKMNGMEFADSLLEQATDCGVEIELDTVISIDDQGDKKIVITEDAKYEAKAIILATGSEHRKLGVPREDEFSGHGVAYCATCDGAFYKGRPVAIVGGGNAAFSEAIFLSNICESVTLIHRRDEFRAEEAVVERAKKIKNIRFLTNTKVTGLIGEKNLEGLEIIKTDATKGEIPVDAVFVAIGRIPKNKGLCKGLNLDESGYVLAGEDCKTNIQGIYVAGDCRHKEVRQLTTAVGDAAVAAMSI